MTSQERLGRDEVRVTLEATLARRRVAVSSRPVGRPAVRTRLRRPRLRTHFDLDPILFGGVCESADEPAERPEVVRLLVRPDGPLRFEDVHQVAHVHGRNAFVVETFDEVASERVLCVVAPSRPPPVQPVDLLDGGRTERPAVASAVLADVPDVTVRVGVVLAALVSRRKRRFDDSTNSANRGALLAKTEGSKSGGAPAFQSSGCRIHARPEGQDSFLD